MVVLLGVLQASADLRSLGHGISCSGPVGPGPGAATTSSNAGCVAGGSSHTVAPAWGCSGGRCSWRGGGGVVASADSLASRRLASARAGCTEAPVTPVGVSVVVGTAAVAEGLPHDVGRALESQDHTVTERAIRSSTAGSTQQRQQQQQPEVSMAALTGCCAWRGAAAMRRHIINQSCQTHQETAAHTARTEMLHRMIMSMSDVDVTYGRCKWCKYV